MARSGNSNNYGHSGLSSFETFRTNNNSLSTWNATAMFSFDTGTSERRYFVLSSTIDSTEICFGQGGSAITAKNLFFKVFDDAVDPFFGDGIENTFGVSSYMVSPSGGLAAALATEDPVTSAFFDVLDVSNPDYLNPVVMTLFEDDGELYQNILIEDSVNVLWGYYNCQVTTFRSYSGNIYSGQGFQPSQYALANGFTAGNKPGIISWYPRLDSFTSYSSPVRLIMYASNGGTTKIISPSRDDFKNAQEHGVVSTLLSPLAQEALVDVDGVRLHFKLPFLDEENRLWGHFNPDFAVGTPRADQDSLEYTSYGPAGSEKVYLNKNLAVAAYSGLVLSS